MRRIQGFQYGFTLIELMIAMLLGLFIVGGAAGIFVYGSRSYRQDERTSRVMDAARFSVAQLMHEVEMTGFYTPMHEPTNVVLNPNLSALDAGDDCGRVGTAWAWDIGAQDATLVPAPTGLHIEILDNATNSTATATFRCFASGEIQAGTDVIAIKRVAGSPTPAANREVGHVYLRTNGRNGALYLVTSGDDPDTPSAEPIVPSDATINISGTTQDYEYLPRIYYVRNHLTTSGDGIPTLCRKILTHSSGDPRFESECFAGGVETMQVELGVDTDNDSAPNLFVIGQPTAAQVRNATALKVTLLARAETGEAWYSNAKTYDLSNAAAVGSVTLGTPGRYTPADNLYRKLIGTTVLLRNPATLRFPLGA
jgi:type IV pilus assembly protein PilW